MPLEGDKTREQIKEEMKIGRSGRGRLEQASERRLYRKPRKEV